MRADTSYGPTISLGMHVVPPSVHRMAYDFFLRHQVDTSFEDAVGEIFSQKYAKGEIRGWRMRSAATLRKKHACHSDYINQQE